MMIETNAGIPVTEELVRNFFKSLVNRFFKILPMREQNEDSLVTYMNGLQLELLGAQGLLGELRNDTAYITLLSILQYMIDSPNVDVPIVKREVFNCISLCNKLKAGRLENLNGKSKEKAV